ncbi:hypothetical protein DD237_002405 [Peronospora effusa]|uniref:RxLR effector protein n=1 Tax=Peronospora effusa TaxID=542832 RepID=A0A425CLG0_9STRA|nr:hypothetical protein DD237_002405 [Peronospora effusa]
MMTIPQPSLALLLVVAAVSHFLEIANPYQLNTYKKAYEAATKELSPLSEQEAAHCRPGLPKLYGRQRHHDYVGLGNEETYKDRISRLATTGPQWWRMWLPAKGM